jgi:hypothetical protein
MRKALKDPASKILTEGWQYQTGNSHHNGKIAAMLHAEQKCFCAYTDEYISRTDAKDIEHFNPLLKDTPADGYHNWFVVKHQWNLEKSQKWAKFQPVLHPEAADFEKRVVYVGGDYIAHSDTDIEAANLIQLLQLDDAALADKRKRYINRKKDEIKNTGYDPAAFFQKLAVAEPCGLHYPRAIREAFGVDVLPMLD